MVRPARLGDGPAIYAVCLAGGMWDIEGLDWSLVGPGWLVSEDTEGLTGCVQICMGSPITRLEMLFIHPRVSRKSHALLVRELSEESCRIAGASGAQAVHFTIPDHYPAWMEVVSNRRCVEWYHGVSYLRKV